MTTKLLWKGKVCPGVSGTLITDTNSVNRIAFSIISSAKSEPEITGILNITDLNPGVYSQLTKLRHRLYEIYIEYNILILENSRCLIH